MTSLCLPGQQAVAAKLQQRPYYKISVQIA